MHCAILGLVVNLVFVPMCIIHLPKNMKAVHPFVQYDPSYALQNLPNSLPVLEQAVTSLDANDIKHLYSASLDHYDPPIFSPAAAC